MSGIAAVLRRTEEPAEDVVAQMLAAAPHRGTARAAAAVGRAVVGISSDDTGDAWLAAQDGKVAALAGSLDNRRDLARTLQARGQVVDPGDPARLVLGAYVAYGEEAPRYLRGAYAAVVTDGSRLLAFRDHLGFASLFYRDDARGILVGSEAKQVAAGAGLPREPDVDFLVRLYYNQLEDETPCALKGVWRVPKGALLSAGSDGPAAVRRYWYPERLVEAAAIDGNDLQARFEELMMQAANRVFTGDDVVYLSGGVDSTAVAAFGAPAHVETTGKPLAALSLVFPDLPRVDERPYIEMTARHLGMSLHTFTSDIRHLDRLDEWSRLVDGPVLVSINTLAEAYRHARALGFRTLLTGELGEYVYDMRGHLYSHLLVQRRFRALRALLRTPVPAGTSRFSRIRQLVAPFVPSPLAAAYLRVSGLDRTPDMPAWLDSRWAKDAALRHELRLPPGRRWRELQVSILHVPWIGYEATEICALLHGVRVRRPLGDVDLWEFFLSLPAEVKFPDTRSKTLIRRLLRGKVPDAVLDRTDKTFFDDFELSRLDYPALRRWLLRPRQHIPGVNYRQLAERLERRNLTLTDYMWARELAAIHAFLSSS